MKLFPALVLLAGCARSVLGAEVPLAAGPVEIQGDHVFLVEGTLSADGRYAAAWTIHPKKGKPPVKWEDKDSVNFFADYGEGYDMVDFIVDLPRSAVAATLHFVEPYFERKNHGSFQVVFGPEREGRRFAIALNGGKWSPEDVVLVELSAGGATQTDILKTMDAAVLKFIQRKGSGKGYATDYSISELPELGLLTGFADANTVRVPFTSIIPKADDAGYDGTVLLRLTTEKGRPQATAGEVRTKEVDPTADDPRIAAADKDLNAAYAALRTKLDADGKARLLDEQRAWIKKRDEKVTALGAATEGKALVNNPRIAADRLLLQLTEERTAALRAR